MKRFCTWMTLLCFASNTLAVDFVALDNSEKGKFYIGNHQAAAYTVTEGTRGKVKFITQLPAQNNRTGEFDSYLGIEIEKVAQVPGVKTGLKPGMVILVYYSAEESQRVMKLTDDHHHIVKNAEDAKYGIATKNFTNQIAVKKIETKLEPKPEPKPELKPEPVALSPEACSATNTSNKNFIENISGVIQCLSEKFSPPPPPPPTPNQNDLIAGEILTYINNFVWNNIQKEHKFDHYHYKDKTKRMAARLAEYKKREKINEITTRALVASARAQHLDEALLVGVAQVESGFDKDLCSTAGACGLFQLMLDTAQRYSHNPNLTEKDLHNSDINSKIASAYLRDLENKFHGDIKEVLYNYNEGETGMRKIRAGKKTMKNETAEYPTKVLNAAMQIKSKVAEAQQRLASNQ